MVFGSIAIVGIIETKQTQLTQCPCAIPSTPPHNPINTAAEHEKQESESSREVT